MPIEIDLKPFFTEEAIKDCFKRHKDNKTDRFHPEKVNIKMGADGITWEDFERNLDKNARNISRRILNGSYRFYPLREVEKLKDNGKVRILSIASIRDVIVQKQLYEALYASAELMFGQPIVDKVSWAYRKRKSAPQVALEIWSAYKKRGYEFALDADIENFFGTLAHERLFGIIDEWVGRKSLAGTFLERYVTIESESYVADLYAGNWQKYFMTHKPKRNPRTEGIPQGGVLSGMLANLYLYDFDCWVINQLAKKFKIRYYRYADDFVILTRSFQTADEVYHPVCEEIQSLDLRMYPLGSEKTKICAIKQDGLEFVGFRFTTDHIRARPKTVQKFYQRISKTLATEKKYKTKSNYWKKRLKLAIKYCVNPKIIGVQPKICETCGLPKERVRNWINFFVRVINHERQLRKMDKEIRRRIYVYFWRAYHVRLCKKDLRDAGLDSLLREYHRQRDNGNLTYCRCEQKCL